MKKREKYEVLKEKLSNSLTFIELVRLITGDLFHIGDAILEDKTIKYQGEFVDVTKLRFLDVSTDYTIVKKTLKVGDRVVNASPISDVEEGKTYYIVDLRNETLYCTATVHDARIFKRDYEHLFDSHLIHASKTSAINHANALLNLSKVTHE